MPEFQYWTSVTAFFVAGSFILNVVLALIGLKKMNKTAMILMVTLAICLAVLGWWSAAKQEQKGAESDSINAEMRTDIGQIKEAMGIKPSANVVEITPKAILETLEAQRKLLIDRTLNNYAYFKLEDNAQVNSGLVKLWLDSSGPVFTVNYWISNASAKHNANDPAYWSVDHRKPLIPIINPNTKEIERSLPVGDYIIEFDGLNGHWDESLSIYMENGKPKQKIRVTNSKGELLYDSETGVHK